MDNRQMEQVISNMSPAEKGVVDAILAANYIDEKSIIDRIIGDVQQRQARYFDVIYVDLSVDRSINPLPISGGGTLLACIEATDNLASCEVAFETEDADTNRRVTMKRGKRARWPFSRFYIYHSAQSGKFLKLVRAVETRSLNIGFEDDSGDSANSDLVTALGNSSAIVTGQVAVSTSSTLIKAANTSRKRITITNNDAGVDLYIGPSGVTTSTGLKLAPGASIVINTTAAIYGVTSSSLTCSYLEE